ncbi:hypothetical protein PCCS19_26610 [Paenibacillus sp. CCS19]|uniref:M67 family metallopeptidase n=1 Tax=Paenibacillus sp. CCS19 TaxID=3158387 RepID=UPI0025647600|nr:M67 family metallopeptidase [Paenibacillus cellulosilyticus]GMK39607.1 hypothetical protein PCCS19_26610 [Paenibacillus cellulosilyticus]
MMRTNDGLPIQLTANAHEQLIAHCRSTLPNEGCGLLISTNLDTPTMIDTIHPIANAHPHPLSSFSFDPAGWISALYRLQRNNQQLVGYYHSHPRSLPIPSSSDSLGTMSQAGAITLIVSFSTSQPNMRAYWKPSDEWLPVALTIESSSDNQKAD